LFRLRPFQAFVKGSRTVEKRAAEIETLRAHVTNLEAREDMLLAKIEAAAAKATADISERLGRAGGIMEGRASRD
jgi:hypothetical protein